MRTTWPRGATARQISLEHLDLALPALHGIECQTVCAGDSAQGFDGAVTLRTICSITCICGAAWVR
jgi:hypothetical protein